MEEIRRRPRRRRRRRQNHLLGLTVILVLVLAGLIALAVALGHRTPPAPATDPAGSAPSGTAVPTAPPTVPPTEPPVVRESSATLSAVGDMLMHAPVFNTGYDSATGNYDLNSIFTYFTDYVRAADIAVGNLETTLAGTGNGYAYSGYPQFNCPDGIVGSMANAGFDVVLTANNHSYDTRHVGLLRTQQIIRDAGLPNLGTKEHADDPNFIVLERNGIRMGLACYTYETDGYADRKSLNGIGMDAADAPLINSFDYKHLDLFYSEVADSIAQMEEQGADAVILFVHWGEEYQLKQNATQSAIAQSLCDLGVDVIIGGHPHVVQPVELLTSTTDPEQKTVCLYSMGNAVSNQRRENMNLNTGHTEDGVMFSVTFTRYSDGTVILENADVLPTWVDLRTNALGRREYNILPLDTAIEDWQTQFSLSDSTYAKVQASYDRTMAIVGEGLTTVQDYLSAHTAQVEAQLGVQ